MSFCKKAFIFTIVSCIILMYVPGIPPHVKFSAFVVDPARPFEGPLEPNSILDSAERMYEGHLNGPESIASRAKDEIFVSSHGGEIIRIWGKNYENSQVVVRIGPGCANSWDEQICGKALGIRFDKAGKLYVADAYMGLFSVDVDAGKKQLIVDPSEPIDGLKPLIIDDLDIDSAGNIYFSDASTKATLDDSLLELTSDPSGRLLKYDAKTKKTSVLIPKLQFANGVQLSPDESFVLISETARHRVHRHWLKGSKKGKTEIFVSGLPGMPDNIRARKEGGYYISLPSLRSPDKFDLFAFTAQYPALRTLISRLKYGIKSLFAAINSIYPNDFSAQVVYNIFNLEPLAKIHDTGRCVILEVDENGTIIGSLQGSSGQLSKISEANRVGNDIFFGSPYNNYLGRLQLKGDTLKKKPEKAAGKKPTDKKDEL